jgi:ATP-binding cassette, subfamily C (CFTR/MRP), member 1
LKYDRYPYLSIYTIEDFWELPNPQLTSTLSTELENIFYLRCPPEKRPEYYRSQYSPSVSPKEEEPTSSPGNKENTEGEKTTSYKWYSSWFHKKPKVFKADNEKYDSSLLKALHRTFFVRWWTAGILVLIAGMIPSLQFSRLWT